MLRSVILTCCMALSVHSAKAQYVDAGAILSAWNYRGDIPTRHMDLDKYQPGWGVFARYNASPNFAFKLTASRGSITAYDPVHQMNGHAISSRNLRFRTEITEVAIQYEWNITGLDFRLGKKTSPYVFAGLSGFYFNPQTQYQGQWIDLQPLGTEGQIMEHGKGYNRYQLAIPFGLGFRWAISPRVHAGLEFGARKTFTDYLDDVSGAYPDLNLLHAHNPLAAKLSDRSYEVPQSSGSGAAGKMRGNPDSMDWFFQNSVSVSIALGKKSGTEFDPKMKVFLE